jgi:hypothetical protein
VAVPSSHTFVDGVLTSSEMNAYIRDPISFLLQPPLARLRQTVVQSIPSSTFTAITFTTEDVDTDVDGVGGHSNAINTSRFTSRYSGWYEIGGGVAYAANATGRRLAHFYVNGAAVNGAQVALPATAANDSAVPAKLTLVYLAVGDYVELMAYQESGGALNTFSSLGGMSTLEITMASI